MQHEPWPSPSAWTKTRSLHGCRNFYLLVLPSLSFSLSFSLSLLLLILDRTDVCSPLLRLFPLHFRARIDFLRKNGENLLLCSHSHTAAIVKPTCLPLHSGSCSFASSSSRMTSFPSLSLFDLPFLMISPRFSVLVRHLNILGGLMLSKASRAT